MAAAATTAIDGLAHELARRVDGRAGGTRTLAMSCRTAIADVMAAVVSWAIDRCAVATDHAFDRATSLVNHVFLWLLGLLVLFLLGLLLVTALLARAWRQGEGLPWDRSRGGVGSSRERSAPVEPAVPGPAPSVGEHPAEPHH